MERIFRVQTVKLVGPGFSSTSPERRSNTAVRRTFLTYRLMGNFHENQSNTVVDLRRRIEPRGRRTEYYDHVAPVQSDRQPQTDNNCPVTHEALRLVSSTPTYGTDLIQVR